MRLYDPDAAEDALALRLPKGRPRRDRAGAPMKRG